MNVKELDRPEYEPLKGAMKGVGASVVTLAAVKLAAVAQSNGVPADAAMTSAAIAWLFGAVRNVLKVRFGWHWIP